MTINNLVETHSHILPNIDDGASNIETSLKMIASLAAQGAKAIILTPHYYSDSISLNDFIKRRDMALFKLIKALPAGSPKLIPAAEVYVSEYLFHNEDLSPLCIGNTRHMLIEHPFATTFSERTCQRLSSLIYDYNTKPILAHIERYKPLIQNTDIIDRCIEMGCMTQVNISSFDKDIPKRMKKKLFKYLETDRIHLIGSDCHNLDTRPPNYSGGTEEILKKCGTPNIDKLMNNAWELIK